MKKSDPDSVHREISPPRVNERGEFIFSSREELELFLAQHPEVESKEHELYQPVDVSFEQFRSLQTIVLEFEPYKGFSPRLNRDFSLGMDRKTNILYLDADNLGGHGGRWRIVKIVRRDIFERPDFLESWYRDYAAKFWS